MSAPFQKPPEQKAADRDYAAAHRVARASALWLSSGALFAELDHCLGPGPYPRGEREWGRIDALTDEVARRGLAPVIILCWSPP